MNRSLWCAAVLFTFWACGGGDANPGGASNGDAGDAALGGQTSLAGSGAEQDGGSPEGFGGSSQPMGGTAQSMAGAAAGAAGAAGAASSSAGQPTLGEGGAGGAPSVVCPDAFTGASCDLPRFELLALPQAATKGVAVGLSADGAVVAGNVTTAAAQAGFRWTHAGGVLLLDALPTQTGSAATAISADGKVIIGTSGVQSEATYWPAGKGTPQSLLTAAWKSLQPLFVSADGSVISGVGTLANDKLAPFRWTKAGGPVTLGAFPVSNIYVVGMSADGSVIVGNSGDAATTGFVWKSAGGLGNLTTLAGDDHTNILALSADGSTVVGDSLQGITKWRRVRWLSSTQPVLLDPLDAGTADWLCAGGPFSTCTSMSRDGSVIYTTRNSIAQRWTAAKGLEALPLLTSPAKFNCRAYSPEVPLLAWVPGNCIGPPLAVIWDDKSKVNRVDDVLATFGVTATELTNATISVVRAISADGTTILGDNFDKTVVWIARVLR